MLLEKTPAEIALHSQFQLTAAPTSEAGALESHKAALRCNIAPELPPAAARRNQDMLLPQAVRQVAELALDGEAAKTRYFER